MEDVIENNALEHIGILGMRWGHRKSSGWTPGISRVKKQANRTVKSITGEKPRMTDLELRNRISRLQMEQTYAQLTKPKVSVGRKLVMDVIQNSGKQVATAYVTKMMSKALGIDPVSVAKAAKETADAAAKEVASALK